MNIFSRPHVRICQPWPPSPQDLSISRNQHLEQLQAPFPTLPPSRRTDTVLAAGVVPPLRIDKMERTVGERKRRYRDPNGAGQVGEQEENAKNCEKRPTLVVGTNPNAKSRFRI